jgi:hypothetical protein
MCEALGAYGWAEDTTVMKYILDHFMVRGINHFVPHAFDSKFPDPDCPPHFGIEGKDPSFDGFTALMGYTNKVCHLLYNTKHIAKTAIFYPYENDWASRFDNAMTIEKVAVPLYDAHIDFDIVPHDYLGADKISDGKLCLGEEQFECLVIPYADHISADVAKTFNEMQAKGLTLIFVNDKPENVEIEGKIIALESLAEELTAMGMAAKDQIGPGSGIVPHQLRAMGQQDGAIFGADGEACQRFTDAGKIGIMQADEREDGVALFQGDLLVFQHVHTGFFQR